jgi:hypothetical protein
MGCNAMDLHVDTNFFGGHILPQRILDYYKQQKD